MTSPISANSQNNVNPVSQPIGAFGLGSSKKFEPGSFVVNPPSNIVKYSLYDELDLGKDRYEEFLGALISKSAVKNVRKSRKQRVLSKIINWGLVLGGGYLAYKYRSPLKNILVNGLNLIKKCFKK